MLYKIAQFGSRKLAHLPLKLAGQLDTSIAFIHIPKCGGTSLHQAIAKHYPASKVSYLDPSASRIAATNDDLPMLPARRAILAYQLAKRDGHRFISGHWPVDHALIENNRNHWAFMTLLRNPVERWFSNYFFNRFRQTGRDHFGTTASLEDYLNTKDASENGKLYLSFCLGGAMPDGDLSYEINHAIEVLSKFQLLGVLDDLEGFLDRFEAVCKLRPRIALKNANPANQDQKASAITPALRQEVEKLCAPDMAIYQAILNKLA